MGICIITLAYVHFPNIMVHSCLASTNYKKKGGKLKAAPPLKIAASRLPAKGALKMRGERTLNREKLHRLGTKGAVPHFLSALFSPAPLDFRVTSTFPHRVAGKGAVLQGEFFISAQLLG